MAYCVECGVELAASESRCALCKTEVMKPGYKAEPSEEFFAPAIQNAASPRPNRNLISLISFLVIIAGLITVTIDMAVDGIYQWSIIVHLSLAQLWAAIVLPLTLGKDRGARILLGLSLSLGIYLILLDAALGNLGWGLLAAIGLWTLVLLGVVSIKGARLHPVFTTMINGVILAAFLLVLNLVYLPGPWYFPVALPASFMSAGYFGLLLYLGRRFRATPVRTLPAIVLFTALFNVSLDIIVSRFLDIEFSLSRWSIWILGAGIIAAALIQLLMSTPALRNWFDRHFHF